MSAGAPQIDNITLEVLRTRLAAIAEEGALTIERTACSPVIAESRDCSCTLLDADSRLLMGGGSYADSTNSRAFPFLPVDAFATFIPRMIEEDESRVLLEFREWVRGLPR